MHTGRPRILLIDDTPVNLILLGNALEEDYDLRIATSGEEGLRLTAEVMPDLILLDIMMPGIDGLETCRILKADPALKQIPVIFITALGEPEFEATGLTLGASDYLSKPINVELARQRIHNLLDREQLRKEVEAHRDRLEVLVAERTAQLAASEAMYRGLVEQSVVGVYQVQGEKFAYANPGLARMMGYASPAEMIARASPLLMVPEPERENLSVWPDSGGAVRSIQFPVICQEGSVIEVESHETLLETPAGRVILGICVDVTERKRAEQAQAAALRAAEHLAELKSQFVNNVSHELKTPLNAVLGFSEVGLATQDITRAHRFFGLIRDAGNRLLEISGSMLDFAQAEAGKLSVEQSPFDLTEVLAGVTSRWQPAAESKGLSFATSASVPAPCIVTGDARRVTQLLGLLMDNAVKFTTEGSVSLSCDAAGDVYQLTIEDTGIGMQPEQVQQAFNPFHQADGSRTRQFGGLGLGLALAKYLVDRMRGEINVESSPGAGTRFRIRLPIGPDQGNDLQAGTPT